MKTEIFKCRKNLLNRLRENALAKNIKKDNNHSSNSNIIFSTCELCKTQIELDEYQSKK